MCVVIFQTFGFSPFAGPVASALLQGLKVALPFGFASGHLEDLEVIMSTVSPGSVLLLAIGFQWQNPCCKYTSLQEALQL